MGGIFGILDKPFRTGASSQKREAQAQADRHRQQQQAQRESMIQDREHQDRKEQLEEERQRLLQEADSADLDTEVTEGEGSTFDTLTGRRITSADLFTRGDRRKRRRSGINL